jgi:sterol desaturase/sphingolipid hydroxylase (fatty acid hydroxylase superfamily)
VLLLAGVRCYVAAIAVLKHELTHIAVHRMPGLRYLHRHHFLHHRNPECNFSFSAVWPDRLFGTLEC